MIAVMIDQIVEYRGSFLPRASLALVLTRKSAYVWDYQSQATSPSTQAVKLPFPSDGDEPLPLGAVVKPTVQSDTGLVVISPRSGKIKYWENIENADALSLFARRRDGTEGSMGLYSGETILDIEDAHHAGFIVTTSNGRVAQLQLRDAQSRPSVNVEYFRSGARATSGGLFGGIMNVFGSGGLMKDVTAVHIQPSDARGPANVIVASEHASFQNWRLTWSESPSLVSEANIGESMEEAALSQLQAHLPGSIQSTQLVDVAFISEPSNEDSSSQSDGSNSTPLVGLVRVVGPSFTSYAVSAINAGPNGDLHFGRMTLLDCYAAPLSSDASWKPHLAVPSSSRTAFAVFEKAVVLASLNGIESRTLPRGQQKTFQDVLYLKDEEEFCLSGLQPESSNSKRNESPIVLFVRGSGVLRVMAKDNFINAERRHQFSIKSRLEQVVLYSSKPSNPLNLARAPDTGFNRREVEEAALVISHSILTTEYPSLATHLTSMSTNLLRRAQALERLAKHVKDTYPELSRLAKWHLRWDAEKMATARELWNIYDKRNAINTKGIRRRVLLPEITELIQSNLSQERTSHFTNIDTLREFFLIDIPRTHYLLTWTYSAIHGLAREFGVSESDNLMEVVLDATHMIYSGLKTAFDFRVDNAWLYNLEKEDMDANGLLQAGYAGLDEFWTSTYATTGKIRELAQSAQDLVVSIFDKCTKEERTPPQVALEIAERNVDLIESWCRAYEERCRWCAASSDPKIVEEGQGLRVKCDDTRGDLIVRLAWLDQTFRGMELAEKLMDMVSLTKLVRDESQELFHASEKLNEATPGETIGVEREREQQLEQTNDAVRQLEERIARYCRTYGYTFTNKYYGAIVEKHAFGTLIEQNKDYRKELRDFLHKDPIRRPLAWINDIIADQKYSTASDSLIQLATGGEPKAWNRGVDLGFAKLSLLAADEQTLAETSTDDDRAVASLWQQNLIRHDNTKLLLKIESHLWEHVRDLTYNALDGEGMVQLLMESLGTKLTSNAHNALLTLLERSFDALVNDQALGAEALVDILTLMDSRPADREDADISGKEHYFALLAIKHDDNLSKARKDILSRLVWRRALLGDDDRTNWKSINKTLREQRLRDDDVNQLLRQTVAYHTLLEGYRLTLEHDPSAAQSMSPRNAADSVNDTDVEMSASRAEPATEDDRPPLSFMCDQPTPDPRDCTNAGARISDWTERFGEDREDLAEPIAAECREEGEWLVKLIDEQEIVGWWNSCRELARADAMAV